MKKSITNTRRMLAEHYRPGNITYLPPSPKRLKVLINDFFFVVEFSLYCLPSPGPWSQWEGGGSRRWQGGW